VTATQTNRAISLLYALTGSYGALGGNVPETAATFADISGQDLLSPEQREKALGLTRRPPARSRRLRMGYGTRCLPCGTSSDFRRCINWLWYSRPLVAVGPC